MNNERLTFNKDERLKSSAEISRVFNNGQSLLIYPVRVIWIPSASEGPFPVKAAFGVARRNFKNAVDRNAIKRKMKEIYRLNKSSFYSDLGPHSLSIMFFYIARVKLPYRSVEKAMLSAMRMIARTSC